MATACAFTSNKIPRRGFFYASDAINEMKSRQNDHLLLKNKSSEGII
jgi:hypothetical protein